MERGTVPVSIQTGALERAHLVREIAELLSIESPMAELWERCATLLSALAGTDRVQIVLQDGPVRAGSVAAEAIALGATVVRNAGNGYTIGVPIRFGRASFGAICVELPAYDAESTTLLESCALAIGARLRHDSATANSERFANLAFTDSLTGIANRRHFDDDLAREWTRAARAGTPVSLLMIDLDYFKSYNDAYGHQSGDLCLQRVAHALYDCVRRPADAIARYGGEEFVALLPATDLNGATALAEEMRAAVAALDLAHEGSTLGRISLSVGAACITPEPGEDSQALLRAADDALYHAKLAGRNRAYANGYQSDAENARPKHASAPNNLPVALTRLVGRKAETAHLRALLEKHRLVSVVGTGGTGKTRVALAVATESSGRFGDGAWFVDLSPISDPSLIASTIAAVFEAEVSMGESAADALAVILESKDALVVIDNCEHLLAEVANLAVALLRHSPKLSIMTTTREPLGIPGEAVYRLPLLSLPPSEAKLSPEEAVAFDAVALFVERAAESAHGFELTAENVADAVEICRAVDGIALAIELAASRVGITGVAQVAERLREFRLLTGGDRTALPRQRTMHAMIGWSYDLLDERERTLFRRLSIFAGCFTFDAVTEICAGTPVDAEDVYDLLSSLIRKSLVSDDPGHESRYRLLDSVRAFAKERLLEAGEAARLAHWHTDYYEQLARAADSEFRTMSSREWTDALTPDVDNFRAALEWSLDQRGDVELGAALAASVMNFFNDYMPAEAIHWLRKALQTLPRGATPRLEARLCFGMAANARDLPATDMRAASERAIELYRAIGDRAGLAEALRGAAQIVGWYFREDRELADALACESIAIARELGDPIQIAISLRTRGLTMDISDFPAKRAVLEESLALIREHGNERQIASMLTWRSDLEFSAGDLQAALEFGRESVPWARASGSNELVATALGNIANYACAAGEWDTARQYATETVSVSRKTRHYQGVTFGVQALAIVATEEGDYERAARLIGFCDVRCAVLHAGRQADQSEDLLYRSLLKTLRERLGDDGLARAMSAGSNLNEEEAVALAERVQP